MSERTLPQHVLAWTLPFVLGVGALVPVCTYLVARAIIVQQLEKGARQQAASAASEVRALWDEDRSTLLTLAESPLFVDYAKNRSFGLEQETEVYRRELENMLTQAAARHPSYARLRFLDARGREVVRVQDGRPRPPAGGTDAEAALLARRLRPGETRAEAPVRVPWHAWPLIVRRAAVFEHGGGPALGVLAVDESFQVVADALSRFRIGASGRVSVAGAGAADPGGAARVRAAANVEGTPLTVVFSVERGEFVRPLWLAGVATALLTLFALLLLAVGLPEQLRRLLRPIETLAETARLIASGSAAGRVPTDGPREVAQLAEAFNTMVASLRERSEALVQSEERYRNAVENSPHAVVSLDQNLRVTLWNRRAEALFGYQPTEAFGRSLAFILVPQDFERLKRQVETEGSVRHGEAVGVARDGRRLDLNVSWTGQASPRGAREWFVLLQDETEKKRLQAQLIQAEKLSAVGTLIAGVAHELNNPLAAVLGFAEMLASNKRADPDEREDLRLLGISAARCRDIVQGLLSFVRQGKSVRQRVPLNYLVHATVGLLEYRLVRGEGVKVELELDKRTPYAAADFSRLQQIVVNLMTNSADAMRGQTARRVIRVRTRRLADGCELEVEDTGPGLPPEVRAKLFQPFVTTKPVGIGTGLGLSISAKTAEEFGGSLRYEDAPGGGARFVARFPPCPAGLQEAETSLNLPPPRPGTRVLVVDDEPELAQLVARVLSEDGMEARAATDLAAAARALDAGDIELVVADVELGPSKGFELFDGLDAGLKRPAFVFMTGDVLNEDLRREAGRRGAPLLAKPFLRTDLLRCARRAAAAAQRPRPV